MAITASEAAELADRLSDELSCDNARMRLLCITELLCRLTDRDHPLTNSDIRAILVEQFGEGCAPAENTIIGDIHALRDSGFLGLEVHVTPSGTWCESSRLSPDEVQLLLNAVQSSRILTQRQSAGLQGSLLDLVSCWQEDELDGEVFVDQRGREKYQHIFKVNAEIARAIRLDRKIEFEYTYTGFDRKPHALADEAGKTLRVETPVALIYADGKYYMESYSSSPWRGHPKLIASRTDRMFDVRVSEERAEHNVDTREARNSVRKRLRESFEMVGGTSRILFLRVAANMTNVMFDTFGYDLRFAHFSGEADDVETTAVTCVKVADSFTFYRWLSSAGDRIVIEKPLNDMWVRVGAWDKIVGDTPIAQLQEDYKATVEAYLAYLDRARAPYMP